MKHIKIERVKIVYPVGKDITNAKLLVRHYYNAFNSLSLPKKDINIWCRGSSGAILAALFAAKFSTKFSVTICHIKKEGEYSHQRTLGYSRDAYNLLIDDFISSGATVKAILTEYKIRKDEEVMDFLFVVGGVKKIPGLYSNFTYLVSADEL